MCSRNIKTINRALEILKVNPVLENVENTSLAKRTEESFVKAIRDQLESVTRVDFVIRAFQLTRKADINLQISELLERDIEDIDPIALENLSELLLIAANEGGQAAIDRLQVDKTFNLEDDTSIRERVFDLAGIITVTSLNYLSTKIEQAKGDLLTPEEAVESILEEIPDVSRTRAKLIVDQEIANMAGRTEFEVFRRAGTLNLEWNTVMDERVCPICEPMDGQIRSVGTDFLGGGGEPSQHPPIHIRCRCFLTPKEVKPTRVWTGS